MAIVGVEQISKALGVTPRRVNQLALEGLPRAGYGRYDLGQCMSWYVRFLQKALAAPANSRDGSIAKLLHERIQAAAESAERAKVRNAKVRGEVILASEVRAQAKQVIKHLETDLGDDLAGRISGDPLIQAAVKRELKAARDRFEAGLASLVDD